MSEGPNSIHLSDRELEQVRSILKAVAPGQKVLAFGSRVHGRRLKRFSDLDLAIEAETSPGVRFDLLDAFEESSLPFKVDIVDLSHVDEDFRARISNDLVPVV